MPTYEYECSKCNQQFEFFQSINDAPKQECEVCGGKLTKLLSAGSGLIFKGSGFYITDYKSKTGDSGGASESKSSAETKPTTSAASTPASSSPAAAGGGDKK